MKILNKRIDEIPKGAVPVYRPSVFGNPFKLDKGHTLKDRKGVIEQYKTYFNERVKNDATFRAELAKIVDAKALVCWCAPDLCHAEVIRGYLLGLKAQKFMDACPDSVSIGACWKATKKHKGGFEIRWSVPGVGFGSFTFTTHGSEIVCDNETMGKPFIKKILAKLVDQAVMSEPHPKDKEK